MTNQYFGFDIDPTETYAYFLYSSSIELKLLKFNCDNGDPDSAYRITTLQVVTNAHLSISLDNLALFINTYRLSTDAATKGAAIVRWNFTSTDFQTATYAANYEAPKEIIALSNTECFYIFNHMLSFTVYLIKTRMHPNFNTQWTYQITCPSVI